MQPIEPTLTPEKLRMAKKNAIKSLESLGIKLSSSTTGNLVANILGYQNWNVAKVKAESATAGKMATSVNMEHHRMPISDRYLGAAPKKTKSKEIKLPSSGEIIQASLMFAYTGRYPSADDAIISIAKSFGFSDYKEFIKNLRSKDFPLSELELIAKKMTHDMEEEFKEDNQWLAEEGKRIRWSEPYIDLPTGTVSAIISISDDDYFYTVMTWGIDNKKETLSIGKDMIENKVLINEETGLIDADPTVYRYSILELLNKRFRKLNTSLRRQTYLASIEIGDIFGGIELTPRDRPEQTTIHHFFEVISKTEQTVTLREVAAKEVHPDQVPEKYLSKLQYEDLIYVKPAKGEYIGAPIRKKPTIQWFYDDLFHVSMIFTYDSGYSSHVAKYDPNNIANNHFFNNLEVDVREMQNSHHREPIGTHYL